MTRIRALVIAEAANPEWVSVPLVGWSHANALREVADVHVVTQVRNREAFQRAGWVEGRDFTSLDTEYVARGMWHVGEVLRGGTGRGWTTVQALSVPSYYAFEAALLRQFAGALRRGEYDLIHRITPLSPTSPSILASPRLRSRVPFVVGPLNGGVPWPRQFDGARRAEREWLSYVRGAYRALPGHRTMLRHSNALIVGSRDTLAQIPARYHARCVYVPENGIDPSRFDASPEVLPARPLRVAFVGRLVPYKGADMLIEALAPAVRRGDVVIDILGDGPEMEKLQRMRSELGVVDGVNLPGWIPHAELKSILARAAMFVFPSIREFGGGAVLEAMACGLVPMVIDYGGPAELVTSETGYLIPMGSRADIVDRLRRGVDDVLAEPPEALRERSRRARARVLESFTWQAKARQTLAIYEWVLGQRTKPDFGTPLW
ncbi:MAG: glycosyltransferase [Myxococcota bacterium]|jgi:glycosyltransferase involved in cell wall biosynthesis|nr:glycosyltransferase [Myxococcota bacterium]